MEKLPRPLILTQSASPWGAVLIGACAVLLFFLGRWTAPASAPVESVQTVVQTDTLTIRDTVTTVHPVASTQYVRDSILVPVPVRDTITIRDTFYVSLPREVKTYQDPRYYAEVSGVQPALDLIEIFEETKIVTTDRTTTVTRRDRWGLGVQVGAGLTINEQPTWAPYIGVGLTYNLLSW